MASLEDRAAIMVLSCTKLTCGYSATGDVSDRDRPLVTLRAGTRGARRAQVAAVSRVDDLLQVPHVVGTR
jgi:hypothetical protein